MNDNPMTSSRYLNKTEIINTEQLKQDQQYIKRKTE